MKRFWLVLLSLGLVLAFSASAMAVDVKFSGSFYAAGMYQNKTSFYKDTASDGPSTAFYYQRLRVKTDFIVSPGLSLITRFDAMERAWGAYRATRNLGGATANNDIYSSGTTAENENIAFDLAYVSWVSPIGMFNVGYQADGAWGTVFGDDDSTVAKLQFVTKAGPVTLMVQAAKFAEKSLTSKDASVGSDRDIDKYTAVAVYAPSKDIEGGLLAYYARVATSRTSGLTGHIPAFKQILYAVSPYAKAKIGPVSLQTELTYAWGKAVAYDSDTARQDVDLTAVSAWVDATADFGMFYAGGTVAYMSGDDPGSTEKVEGNILTGGSMWNPTLIMFNQDRYYWAGSINGYGSTKMNNANQSYLGATSDSGMTNAWFFQGRVGIRPVPALDILASLSFANADKKGNGTADWSGYYTFANTNSNAYGWELDITGTYKITNNLSYMLGLGYLWTGDYYKGTDVNRSVSNNYLLINKLTLTF